jgi:pimeloyl-ACP methyl ester carboxylesterase
MSREMFAPQLERFGERYRCVVWDERGHGNTGDVTAPFTYWDSAEDLVAVLRAAGIERATLVGHSQGGYLSLRAALAHPEIVEALILIDTQSRTEDPETAAYYGQLIEGWLAEGMDDELAATIAGIILGQGYADAERWTQRWKQVSPENLQQIMATLAGRDDITDRLGEITAPALVIHGEQDAAIPLDRARELARRIPNAELVTIPGAGHAANLTHPDEVNRHIERFLAERS